MRFPINHLLELLRLLLSVYGVFLAWEQSKALSHALDILLLWVVLPVSGLTGLESVFFGKEGQRLTGYRPSPYQRQSGCNNLALATGALLVSSLDWGIKASTAICLVFLVFLILSGLNHLYNGLYENNYSSRAYTRPLMTFSLLLGMLPFVIRGVLT